MIFQNGIDGLCAPRCCLHPIHRDRLCCVTTVWLCAICGLKVLHKHLFMFLPLCFPSAALVHKRHVLAVLQCMSRGEFTALRCGRVNSMCTTGCLLEVCSLKGFVCVLQTNSPARQTGLSSQLYRLKQKKWKGEKGMLENNKRAFQVAAPPQNSHSSHPPGSDFSKHSHLCYLSISLIH